MEDRAGGSYGGGDASRLGGDSRDVFSAEEPLGPQAEHRTRGKQAGEDERDVGRRRLPQECREKHHPDDRESQGGAAEVSVNEFGSASLRDALHESYSAPAKHGIDGEHQSCIDGVTIAVDSIVSG